MHVYPKFVPGLLCLCLLVNAPAHATLSRTEMATTTKGQAITQPLKLWVRATPLRLGKEMTAECLVCSRAGQAGRREFLGGIRMLRVCLRGGGARLCIVGARRVDRSVRGAGRGREGKSGKRQFGVWDSGWRPGGGDVGYGYPPAHRHDRSNKLFHASNPVPPHWMKQLQAWASSGTQQGGVPFHSLLGTRVRTASLQQVHA